jgi:hypothetical protein
MRHVLVIGLEGGAASSMRAQLRVTRLIKTSL